jgi:parallel beta-helix repeat protein
MRPDADSTTARVCPKTGRVIRMGGRHRWVAWVFPLAGLVSLLWFLIRVIPKPSRATYPCQRLAAPLASGFVIWLTGLAGSTLAYRKARRLLGQSRYVIAGVFLAVAAAAVWWSLSMSADRRAAAGWTPSEPPNSPMGVGQGIFPGRVVWVHEPEAARWDGKTGPWWDDQNVDPQIVDSMVSQALRTLTGQTEDAAAWDALFRFFNRTRGLGDVGYQRGEKIAVKINMNQDSGGTWSSTAGMPSPQMIHSLLDQLIHVVGVAGADITIYDASRYIGDPIYNKVRGNPDPDFQAVRFVCNVTVNGRVGAVHDPAHPVRFADRNVPGNATAYLPRAVTEAKYMINMALLRAHSLFGVTLCGKNNFGSIYWPGNGGWTPSPLHNFGDRGRSMGSYGCLVDLTGHAHLGGKTLLYLIDGLYGARDQSSPVMRWSSFGDQWTASLLLSQDPIAIDSVGLDFLRNEPLATECTGPGVDNYLHEGALAHNPPSGVLYDPEGDGTRLESLGVHEHWNNAAQKKYSRNLGTGNGIDLVTPSRRTENGRVRNLTKQTRYDYIRHAVQDADAGDIIVAAPGVYRETVNFGGRNFTVTCENQNDPAVVAATIIDGVTESVAFSGGEDAACVLAGFTLTGATRGIYCRSASPTIRNCQVVGNVEAGINLWESANPTILNCIIAGNGGDGVEMYAAKTGRLVAQNYATLGYCTIVGNRAHGIRGGEPIVVNSIVYANNLDGQSAQIKADAPLVSYCDVQDGFPGTGNINTDPGFVRAGYWADPADPNLAPAAPENTKAVWVSGDYHLSAGSPCIDVGDFIITSNTVVLTDMDGEPRIVGLRPDLGCDEFVPPPPPGGST